MRSSPRTESFLKSTHAHRVRCSFRKINLPSRRNPRRSGDCLRFRLFLPDGKLFLFTGTTVIGSRGEQKLASAKTSRTYSYLINAREQVPVMANRYSGKPTFLRNTFTRGSPRSRASSG